LPQKIGFQDEWYTSYKKNKKGGIGLRKKVKKKEITCSFILKRNSHHFFYQFLD